MTIVICILLLESSTHFVSITHMNETVSVEKVSAAVATNHLFQVTLESYHLWSIPDTGDVVKL